MVFKEEVKRFCKTTSVKGVPRAAKATHKGLRITWWVAVILMLTMACYQVSALVLEYLSYPSYTVTNENVFHPHNDKPLLPTLTLCNEKVFSSLKPSPTNYELPTLKQYYDAIDHMTQCRGCDDTSQQNMALMRRLMKTTSAYFQNLGHNYSHLVGHDLENFIINCKELVFLGMTFVERSCTPELVNITLSQDTDYFNCYRVTLPYDFSMEKWGMVAGVSLILYLDNINIDDITQINKTTDTGGSINKFGAVAIPTHHEGSAFAALDGIQLPAGISAKIQLAMEKQYRLEPPWGHCQPSPVEGYEAMKMCMSDCFQQHVQQNCYCTDSRMVKHLETKHRPFCLKSHTANPVKPVENYMCATEYLKVPTVLKCVDQCPLTCKEFGYKTETSFSRWPNPSSMSSFYATYISGKDYEKYFTVVHDVITGNCTTDTDCMVKYMMAQRLIEDNFLEVKFHLSDLRYISTEEKEKIRVADFCSKLGGILNLWAGITVVLILEVIELVGRITFYYCTGKPMPVTSAVEVLDNVEKEKPKVDVHDHSDVTRDKLSAIFNNSFATQYSDNRPAKQLLFHKVKGLKV